MLAAVEALKFFYFFIGIWRPHISDQSIALPAEPFFSLAWFWRTRKIDRVRSLLRIRCMLLRDKVWYSGIGCYHQFQPRSQGSLLPVHTEWEREFVCNLPDSGRHVTRPNQGLSTGRRENLGRKLHQFINKKILSLGKTSSTRGNKFGLRWL